MKNALFVSLSVMLFCFACKKENGKTPEGDTAQKYAVRISVSDFSQFTVGFDERHHSSARDAQDTLKDYIQYLSYFVFGGSGIEKRIDQQATDSASVLYLTPFPAEHTQLQY